MIVKFELSGDFAFFRKPDVNTIIRLTYPHIHKVALLGILGAICGYDGYIKQKEEKTDFPEFYEKLKDINVAIVSQKKYFNIFTNTDVDYTGFTNKDGNMIIKEQWLENPKWDIYLLLDNLSTSVQNYLMNSLINNKFIYTPYLGRNSHFANISNIKIFDDYKKINKKSVIIKSIIYGDSINFQENEDNTSYFESFYLPIGLNKDNFYKKEKAYITSYPVVLDKLMNVLDCDNKFLQFI